MNGEMNGAVEGAMESKVLRVAGFGFRREATLDSLADALERIEEQYGAVDRLAAADSMRLKVQALGEARGLETLTVPDALLATAETLTRSSHSRRARGTGSVAEAVALLAAGPSGELLGPRLISPDQGATAAMASAVVTRDTPAGDTT
ncbi:cobalamin biosynthesis protein [Halomonas salinarum]|uniref:cobalamin biosynthesis protein n=1 Tax=Halomonas salinarum TaxID=1158993 RepID=UPI001FD7FFB9|nr:cobalamin biosynthesis protein [Halomonas salinarum]